MGKDERRIRSEEIIIEPRIAVSVRQQSQREPHPYGCGSLIFGILL